LQGAAKAAYRCGFAVRGGAVRTTRTPARRVRAAAGRGFSTLKDMLIRARMVGNFDRIATAAAFALLAASARAAEPGAALDMRGAIRSALESAPTQAIAARSVAIAQSERRGTAAAFLPQLDAAASQYRQTTNVATYGFDFPGLPPLVGPYSVFDARVRLSQKVFDLSTSRQIASADQAVLVARAQERQSREQLAADVALAYVDVLGREQEQSAAAADLALAEDLLTLARDQRHAGIASGIDAVRAETAVAQDRFALSQAQTQLADARLRLQRLAVLPMDTVPRLSGDLESPGEPPATVDAALAIAHEHRPELDVLTAQLHQADAELAAARGKRLPTLSLVGDYGVSAKTPNENDENTYRYGAVLDVPLFTGGSISASVEAAELRIEQHKLELQDLSQQIEQDVRLAIARAANAVEQVHAAAAARELAQRELDLARDRFADGVANNIDVISAQTSLAQARSQYIAALAQRQQARINLAAAEGRAVDFDL
jgi:outer membrane protein TolC